MTEEATKKAKCTSCGLCCTKKICQLGTQVMKNNGLEHVVAATIIVPSRCPFLMLKQEGEKPYEAIASCTLHYFLYNAATSNWEDKKMLDDTSSLHQKWCELKDEGRMVLKSSEDEEVDDVNVAIPIKGDALHPLRAAMACGAGHVHLGEIIAAFPEVGEAIGNEYEVSKILALEAENKSQCNCDECKKERGEGDD